MSFKIAIDGPASAGKSTIAKLLAKELGYIYIDTGAMYRAIGLFLLRNNIDYGNENDIVKVIDSINVSLDYDDDNNLLVFLNGEDVSSEIRTQKVGEAASVSSQFMPVRNKLVSLQRKLAEEKSCAMDGRDIASNVLPNANLKLYVDATVDCRAKRRYDEEILKGIDTTLEKVKNELIERDRRDSTREINPLVRVPGSHYVDTTDRIAYDVVDEILEKFF